MLLNERFEYNIGTINRKGQKIRVAYIDSTSKPNLAGYESAYDYGDEIKSRFGAAITGFKDAYGKSHFWYYWPLGENPEQVIRTKVQPCMEWLTTKEKTNGGPKRDIVASIDELIAKVSKAKMPNTGGASTKDEIMPKLEGFKADLVRITSDDEFKQKMEPIIRFRSANNYQYSLINTILILIQDPKATLVKPGGAWRDYYQRKVKPGSPAISLWIPKGSKNVTEEEKIRITNEFLAKKKVKSVKELSAPDREMLDKRLSRTVPEYFDLAPYWYDHRFTEQMEGTEDILGNPGDNIKWYDDSGEETPELVQHIDALIEVIQERGLNFQFVDNLGGARGVSKSGTIEVLANQPKNAGMFNTIVHEYAHEILHQKYLKSKDEEMKDYFVGTEEGRGKVEQQAELCAWIVLRCFGYDMQTNINYVGIWGLNQDNAVRVFDSVSNVATLISKQIIKKENGQETDMFESKQYLNENEIPSGYEIAQMVGCGSVYKRAAMKQKQNPEVVRFTESELKNFIAESVKRILSEVAGPQGGFADYGHEDMNYESVYEAAIDVIIRYQKEGKQLNSVREVIAALGYKENSFNEADWETVYDACQDAYMWEAYEKYEFGTTGHKSGLY